MSLIPYAKFTRLRLQQFEPSASNEEESACFEFMDSLWYEESIRGAEFLRHERDPHRLGGICLDFRYMSPVIIHEHPCCYPAFVTTGYVGGRRDFSIRRCYRHGRRSAGLRRSRL